MLPDEKIEEWKVFDPVNWADGIVPSPFDIDSQKLYQWMTCSFESTGKEVKKEQDWDK